MVRSRIWTKWLIAALLAGFAIGMVGSVTEWIIRAVLIGAGFLIFRSGEEYERWHGPMSGRGGQIMRDD